MLRQARLLRALARTAVPVPEVLWEDGGDPPEVPPLFVMAFVDGTSLEPLFDLDGDDDAEPVVAERMRNAARALARSTGSHPTSIGLADEPVVGPADEIDRWCRLLETVDPALAPGWEAVADDVARRRVTRTDARRRRARRLPARQPARRSAPTSPRSSTGRSGRSATRASTSAGSSPTPTPPRTDGRRATPARCRHPSSCCDVYADALGRDVPDLEWFQALACFKSAATWSLIVKHNRRRADPDPDVEAMAATLPHLLERARVAR